MKIPPNIAGMANDLIAIRRDIHRHPELCFEEHRTSALVSDLLRGWGAKVTTGLAGTGVVGTFSSGTGNRAIAIRADMDALPIHETTGLSYASETPGKMHACGHDGHTTMLLGLARHLSETMNFSGTVHLVFQPAEEDISGARRMIDEGLFKQFPVSAVYGLHNLPGLAAGQVVVRPGAITAAIEIMDVTVRGIAGHGALPHQAADPVVAASAIVMALQTAVSRNNDALDPAVVTVGAIHGGVLATAIPEAVTMKIAVRYTSKESRKLLARRIPEIMQGQAHSLGCTVEIQADSAIVYPVGYNDPEQASFVRSVALAMGQGAAETDLRGPIMFAEDFSFMLEEVPGCFFGIGNGNSKSLHDPAYDFNDAVIEKGVAFWAELVARALPSTKQSGPPAGPI